MNATVPLEEALPWSPGLPRTIMICDSIETDGRFLLHTMGNQLLKEGRSGGEGNQLWWLTGTPITEDHVAASMKKIGSDVAASFLRGSSEKKKTLPLKIDSLATDLSTKILDDPSFTEESYLRGIFRQVKEWASNDIQLGDGSKSGVHWLFLDDMSSLASMLGDDVLVYKFVDSVCTLAAQSRKNGHSGFGLVLRCSQQADQLHWKASNSDENTDKSGWVGAGGLALKQQVKQNNRDWIPWERSLESVDAIVDVIPLESGYSREAHGRLIFSEYPGGRGWSGGIDSRTKKHQKMGNTQGTSWNNRLINYCLHDNGVRAIRLRESSSIR